MKKSKTKKITKSKAGRPSKYEATKVAKLESAFANSFTVDQACLYAGIDPKTFYRWLEVKKGFLQRMTKAREKPTMTARSVVVTAINAGDVTTSKWWLEKKVPEEFAPNNQTPGVTNNFITLVSKDRDEFTVADSV